MNGLIPTTRKEIANAGGVSFDDLAARFLATRKSDKTEATYRRAIELHRETAVSQDLEPLSGDAIILFSQKQNEAIDTGEISADTARSRLKSVASFFSWCHKFGISPIEPKLVTSELMNIPPARKLSPRDILTETEARALIDAASNNRNYVLVRVLLDSGLRISEALALKVEDVYSDDDRCYIHVAKGKGDKEREVPITAELHEVVSDFVVDLKPRDKIFELHPSNAWRAVKRMANEAGIDKNVTPHSLRHTHANALAKSNWGIEYIAARLGHTSIDTTKIYTRPADLARARTPVMPWT